METKAIRSTTQDLATRLKNHSDHIGRQQTRIDGFLATFNDHFEQHNILKRHHHDLRKDFDTRITSIESALFITRTKFDKANDQLTETHKRIPEPVRGILDSELRPALDILRDGLQTSKAGVQQLQRSMQSLRESMDDRNNTTVREFRMAVDDHNVLRTDMIKHFEEFDDTAKMTRDLVESKHDEYLNNILEVEQRLTTQAVSQLTMAKNYTNEIVQENIEKHTSEIKFARKECKKLHSMWG